MFCPKCGKQLNNNVRFCTACGYQIKESLPEAPKPPESTLTENQTEPLQAVIQPGQTNDLSSAGADRNPVQKNGNFKIVFIIAVLLIACAILGICILKMKWNSSDDFAEKTSKTSASEVECVWVNQAFEIVRNHASYDIEATEIVTRAECAYLLNQIDSDKLQWKEFADINKETNYYMAIGQCGSYMGGWITVGYEPYFYPDDPLLREDLAAGLFYLLDLDGEVWKYRFADYNDFTQDDGTGTNYVQAACAMLNTGIMKPNENSFFYPKSVVTRGDILQMLENLRESEDSGQLPDSSPVFDPTPISDEQPSENVRLDPADGEMHSSVAFHMTEDHSGIVVDTDHYSIELPENWAQYCLYDYEDESEAEARLTFYEKQSYYDGYGGMLFSLILLPQYKDFDFPEATILAMLNIHEYGDYRVIVQYPSDVQFSESGMNRYIMLSEDIGGVLDTFQPCGGAFIQAEQEEDDYWFDTSYIDEASLSEVSRDDIMWARNEIYARHGYIFQNKDIQAAFEATDWYVPNPNYSDSLLNDIEKENLNTIISYEKKMGWRS